MEAQILNSIREETGYSFANLNHVDVREAEVSKKVLPVLVSWIERGGDSGCRSALYRAVGTAPADIRHTLLDSMIQWWQTETDVIARSILSELIQLTMRAKDGRKVWEMCRSSYGPGISFLLRRLANIPATREETLARISNDIRSGEFDPSDLDVYGEIHDSRLQMAIFAQISHPDQRIRAAAHRVRAKAHAIPPWIRPSPGQPDRNSEIYSSEVDLRKLDRELDCLSKRFSFPRRTFGMKKKFLSAASPEQWFVGEVGHSATVPLQLWLRAEDFDTVELVLAKKSGGEPLK